MTTKLTPITDEAEWLEKRKGYITSTESASLFGLQMPSLMTAYELWHIKRGLIENEIEENARMIWGRRFEDVIAQGVAEDEGFTLRPMKAFAYDDEDKIGSSFDFVGQDSKGQFLVEIKTVSYADYKSKFIEDDESDFIEAPPYYEVQVQHELEVLNRYDRCLLIVFVMDTRDVKLLWRDRDLEFGKRIRDKVKEFWNSTEPPAPDLLADSDLLARMQRANSNDSTFDATAHDDFDMWVQCYQAEGEKEKGAKESKKRLRSQMILAMGEHNQAWCNVGRVSNKSSFRVTATKGK